MKTIIVLDGGLGRIISAIPALLKYHKNHINEDWYIMINEWDYVTWGIPELQERTFDPNKKGSFDLFMEATNIISPEPYLVPAYYKNQISLRESFDVGINNSEDHSDLPQMLLNLSISEKITAYDIVENAKKTQNKKKTIVLQPYGSTATPHALGVYDESLRSMPNKMLDYFIDRLSENYCLIYMGAKEFHNIKTHKPNPDPNLRVWAAIIDAADYFIGCDSCGQHMCKALNKKASVFLAGTHKVNVTYNDFHIIEKNIPFYPGSMRISGFHHHMSSRLNEPRINFTEEEIEKAYEKIIENIEGTSVISLEEKKKIKGVSYN